MSGQNYTKFEEDIGQSPTLQRLRNQSVSKATWVENSNQISDFLTPVKNRGGMSEMSKGRYTLPVFTAREHGPCTLPVLSHVSLKLRNVSYDVILLILVVKKQTR